MKLKDVKNNTVYNVDWRGSKYLVLYDETRMNQDYYIEVKRDFFGKNAAFSGNSQFYNHLSEPIKDIIIKEATSIEDRWLRKCITEDEYVECPKDEIINTYSIY